MICALSNKEANPAFVFNWNTCPAVRNQSCTIPPWPSMKYSGLNFGAIFSLSHFTWANNWYHVLSMYYQCFKSWLSEESVWFTSAWWLGWQWWEKITLKMKDLVCHSYSVKPGRIKGGKPYLSSNMGRIRVACRCAETGFAHAKHSSCWYLLWKQMKEVSVNKTCMDRSVLLHLCCL